MRTSFSFLSLAVRLSAAKPQASSNCSFSLDGSKAKVSLSLSFPPLRFLGDGKAKGLRESVEGLLYSAERDFLLLQTGGAVVDSA